MKTRINNEDIKNYEDGSIAFRMRSNGEHFVLRLSKFTENDVVTLYGCDIFDDWSDLREQFSDKSLFGLFNKICKFFGCTIVKFQETLPIVDEALNK